MKHAHMLMALILIALFLWQGRVGIYCTKRTRLAKICQNRRPRDAARLGDFNRRGDGDAIIWRRYSTTG